MARGPGDSITERPGRAGSAVCRCFASCDPPIVGTGHWAYRAGAINEGDQSPTSALECLPQNRAPILQGPIPGRVGASAAPLETARPRSAPEPSPKTV